MVIVFNVKESVGRNKRKKKVVQSTITVVAAHLVVWVLVARSNSVDDAPRGGRNTMNII